MPLMNIYAPDNAQKLKEMLTEVREPSQTFMA